MLLAPGLYYNAPMAGIETAPLLKQGKKLCVDLRKATDMSQDTAREWRAAVAKRLGTYPVIYATRKESILHDKDHESAMEADTVRLDRNWTQKDELYTPDGLRQLIDRENRSSLDVLVAQVRSPMGIVPFVGAGLSVSFGFPSWPKFLTEAAAFHSAPEKVLAEIKENRLIEAATLLYKDSSDRFQRLVEKWFGGPVGEEQVSTGAMSLLPLLARGPVITTNFDHVLEAAYLGAEFPFDSIVTGVEADSVIRAMHRNQHVLIKMHGDASDRSARVFTGLEYDRQYGSRGATTKRGRRSGIPTLARIMFTNRPLLFLGCSLDKDRVLEVLADLRREIPGLTHYAVLAASYSVKELRERRRDLDQYGISPLWFVPGDYKRVEVILQELLQEASTRLLWRNPQPDSAWPKRLPASSGSSVPERRSLIDPGPDPHVTDMLQANMRRLARRIVDGRLAFFLGAGAHLSSTLSAHEFYQSLAKDYQFSEEDSQRAEIAQFMIDREGKPEAWAAAKQKLESGNGRPSPVYEFLAELPGLLRRAGRNDSARQWFLTTNYDTVLEKVLADRGEKFHLLYYQVDGKDEGRFVHRDLDGSIWVIERPQNVRRLERPESIIVKLDGGIPWVDHIPETVAISPLDFSISAGRLPTALPEAIRQTLRTRSLLILGSSLRDAHVQRLVRWAAGGTRVVKTWAVMKPVSATTAKYWSAAGVELIECDLGRFVYDLRKEIEILLKSSASAAP